MKTRLLSLVCAGLAWTATAQVNYSGGVYTQDFNSLDSGTIYHPSTNLPTGWMIAAFRPNTYVWTPVTNGFSNNYGEYAFSSSPDDPDKSIGLLIGSTGAAALGARVRNTTGVALTSFSVSYVVKQWRKGSIMGMDQVIPFSYSVNATSLTNGTFVNVPALDMHSINDGDGTAAALNGNDPANQQVVSGKITGINWPPGQDLWIRWSGVAYSFFQAHALAIDDVSIAAIPRLRLSLADAAHWQLAWETNFDGFVVQTATSPVAANWQSITNVPVMVDGHYVVNLSPGSGPARYFRLSTGP